jgi:nucleotide-binding universal stress UspA family protein
MARVSGRSADLLSYEEVSALLRVTGQSSLGVQQIPVTAIVGSVGRYQDFSRTFLPHLEEDEQRWVSVRAAARHVGDLPPIEVYRIGESYFVLDGNHRVSIARQEKVDYIDAYVTDVRTRVPLPPGARPDELIIAAEHAAFLEATRLDELRPDSDLRVSEPGQFCHLENLIEAYRYLREAEQGEPRTDLEAVADWYDHSYLPLVEAIREQGILRYFPGRTEADFYIWLSRHQAALQHELGWQISPDVTVSRLIERAQADAAAAGRPRSVRQRLGALVLPDRRPEPATDVLHVQRTLARYSDRLFANILLPVPAGFAEAHDLGRWPALQQATMLAVEEGAQLCGLFVREAHDPTAAEAVSISTLRAAFAVRHESLGLSGHVAVESGEFTDRVVKLGLLNDLVVLDRRFGSPAGGQHAPSRALQDILRAARRPVYIVGEAGVQGPIVHLLLALDDHPESDEALFVAAYLGERWRVGVHALLFEAGRGQTARADYVRRYLELHEVIFDVETVRGGRESATEIIAAAERKGADLIVVRGPSHGGRRAPDGAAIRQAEAILAGWNRSLLITA